MTPKCEADYVREEAVRLWKEAIFGKTLFMDDFSVWPDMKFTIDRTTVKAKSVLHKAEYTIEFKPLEVFYGPDDDPSS